MPGEPEKEPSTKDPLTSTPLDMFLSAQKKSSKTQLINSTSTNMSKDPDSAEDLDFDDFRIIFQLITYINIPHINKKNYT